MVKYLMALTLMVMVACSGAESNKPVKTDDNSKKDPEKINEPKKESKQEPLNQPVKKPKQVAEKDSKKEPVKKVEKEPVKDSITMPVKTGSKVIKDTKLTLDSKWGKINYTYGYSIAQQLRSGNLNLDVSKISEAIAKGIKGEKLGLSKDEIKKRKDAFFKEYENRRLNPKYPLNQDIVTNHFYIWFFEFSAHMTKNFDKADTTLFIKGFSESYNGKNSAIPEKEMRQVAEDFEKEMFQKLTERNKKAQDDFFKKLDQDKQVKKTNSGLRYKVLKEGNGKSVTPKSVVDTHYHGTFINGDVFDSSVERKTPFTVKNVNSGIIEGWQEALKMMKEGDKWEVYIPYDLAYGSRPHPNLRMEPCKTLIFQLEIVKVK